MKKADKTNNLSIILFTMKGIISSDKLFTIPGVIVITVGGFSAGDIRRNPLLKTGWIFWSLILFYPFRACIFLEAGASSKQNIPAY
jgi:hypothetical protein